MLPYFEIPTLHPEFVLQSMSEMYDWGLRDLNIPDVHKQTMGEGIKIAIIDSGKSEHFETINRTVAAKNFTDSPTTNDRNGHSTFIAGIIAAEKNNEGIVGVAPKAKLFFAKAMDDSGRGNPAAMVKAVVWAIQQQVHIVSISAGMFFDFKPLRNVIRKAFQKNIVIVAAAGNTGTRHFDVAFPARYPEVIGVAAYNKNHKAARFSSRGISVTCAMPGTDIYSTHLNNQFVKENGTSFACPLLAGICALILARHQKKPNAQTPCRTPREMIQHLEKYAKDLNGNEKEVGFGTLDTEAMFSNGV